MTIYAIRDKKTLQLKQSSFNIKFWLRKPSFKWNSLRHMQKDVEIVMLNVADISDWKECK